MTNTARRIALAVAVLGVVLMGLWSFQRQLVYFPGGPVPNVSEVLPTGLAITLHTEDGLDLGAWWLEGGDTAVIVFPGNAGNRAGRAPLARALHDAGLSVLLVDYRGYGGNPGSPTEEGLLRDARAARSWVDQETDVGAVVYLGESLGTGVAVGLAVETPPAALVLRSPFPSLVAVARQHYGPVPEWLVKDRFPVADQLPDLVVPTLVVVATEDRIIPPELSRRAAAAAGGPVEVVTVDGAGHNDPAVLDGERFISAIVEFLRAHGLGAD
ncbi:MAG: alpha/beta hydrolase [Nitriliruptorales bacterium]|nr:alpha/beta hydrolase [Nitriliruptorales bacterium]